MTHTKGPWVLTHQTATDFSLDVEAPRSHGGLCVAVCGRTQDTESEAYANARLIAAAPEMLEALNGFVEYYAGNKRSQLGNGYAFKFYAIAKGLIRKAEGK